MHIIFPILLLIISVFHVNCCYFEKLKSRYASKLFLMPLLLLCYLDITSNTDETSMSKRSMLMINAILFGFQGDALLIIQNKKCFLMGLFSFLIGHLLYIMTIIKRIETFEPIETFMFPLCVLSLLFICVYVKVYMKGLKEEMVYCGLIYGQTLIVMSVLSLFLAITYKQFEYVLLTCGTFLFCISDGI